MAETATDLETRFCNAAICRVQVPARSDILPLDDRACLTGWAADLAENVAMPSRRWFESALPTACCA